MHGERGRLKPTPQRLKGGRWGMLMRMERASPKERAFVSFSSCFDSSVGIPILSTRHRRDLGPTCLLGSCQ